MPDAEVQGRPTLGVAIPAAGMGRRMGGKRKPLLELRGEPILLHTLRPFLAHPNVAAIVVSLAPEEYEDPPPWLMDFGRDVELVLGGTSRGESVGNALKALPASVDLVAVHDAARPLVTGEILDRCIDAVAENRGAVAGWPAVDTLKQVGEGGKIQTTLPRNEVWHAQTPQVFPRDLLIRAYDHAEESGISDTDDSALVERVGGEVVMVEGSPWNLKVTLPQDLPLAEFLLGKEIG